MTAELVPRPRAAEQAHGVAAAAHQPDVDFRQAAFCALTTGLSM
jgi:hypothetical protein